MYETNVYGIWTGCILNRVYLAVEISIIPTKYSRVSFCDGSFYDVSLLRPLSSRTEHSRLWCVTVATQASLLYLVRFYLFSGVHVFLLFLFQCSSFKFIVIFPPIAPFKKTEMKKISEHLTLYSFLMSTETRPGPSSVKYKVIWLIFFQLSV